MSQQPPEYDPWRDSMRKGNSVPPSYLPQPYQPQYPPQQWQQQVAPKSVLGAVVVSFFIPGTGAIYAGEVGWGITILALWLVSIPLALVTVGIVTGFICWVAGMISAGAAAKKWNRAHGIVS